MGGTVPGNGEKQVLGSIWRQESDCRQSLLQNLITPLKNMHQSTWIPARGIINHVGVQWMSRLLIYTFICNRFMTAAQKIKVDPPSSLQIDDTGYLGTLVIHWKPPATIDLYSQCKVQYELHFPDTGDNLWRAIRTRQLEHRASFNLNKDITVKIRTYLRGACVNDTAEWSEWIEATYSDPLKGSPDSQIEDFQCVYHAWEILNCSWKYIPAVNYEFQYWYEGLAEKKSCDTYRTSDGMQVGCDFERNELGRHIEFFVHVTGTLALNPIRSSYFILNLQDIVKPAAPEEVAISVSTTDEMILEWQTPKGRVPIQCLIYEIESKDDYGVWKITKERESRVSIIKSNSSHIFCTRVRAKVNMICANNGFWSEWSPQTCWKEPPTKYSSVLLYCVIGSLILVMFLCAIAVLVVIKTKRHWSKKLQNQAKVLVYEMEAANMLH
uniref:Interleukin 13 receptor subunit alpha 2 n=2 Tax=Leptobrachium leishanense TaxID=445787 RepID=A0A8C5MGT0_9ANUR